MFGNDVSLESVTFDQESSTRKDTLHAHLERFVSRIAKGSVKEKELPLPNSLSTHIFPV